MTQSSDPSAPLFAEPQFNESSLADEGNDDVQDPEIPDELETAEKLGDDQMVEEELPEEISGSEDEVSVANQASDEVESDGNLIPGGRSKEVLEFLARKLVEDPDAVEVDIEPAKSGAKLLLKVAPDDMGRMIGRKGRVIQAVRVVVRAAAARDKTDATVEIVD